MPMRTLFAFVTPWLLRTRTHYCVPFRKTIQGSKASSWQDTVTLLLTVMKPQVTLTWDGVRNDATGG